MCEGAADKGTPYLVTVLSKDVHPCVQITFLILPLPDHFLQIKWTH